MIFIVIMLPLSLGTIFFWVGLSSLRRNCRLVRDGCKAEATVVAARPIRARGNGSRVWHPATVLDFSFRDTHGQEQHFFRSIALGNPQRFRVGDHVPVIYEEKHPEQARLRSFTEIWFAPTIGLLFGIAGMGIGIAATASWLLSNSIK